MKVFCFSYFANCIAFGWHIPRDCLKFLWFLCIIRCRIRPLQNWLISDSETISSYWYFHGVPVAGNRVNVILMLLVSCILAASILIDLWYWNWHSAAFNTLIWSIVYSICKEILFLFFFFLFFSIWPFQASTCMVMPFMFLCRAHLLIRRFFSALMQEVELPSVSPIKCPIYLWSRRVIFDGKHTSYQTASFSNWNKAYLDC